MMALLPVDKRLKRGIELRIIGEMVFELIHGAGECLFRIESPFLYIRRAVAHDILSVTSTVDSHAGEHEDKAVVVLGKLPVLNDEPETSVSFAVHIGESHGYTLCHELSE